MCPCSLSPGGAGEASLTLRSPRVSDCSEHADLPFSAGRRSHGCEQLWVGVSPSPRHSAKAAGGTQLSPSSTLPPHLGCGFIRLAPWLPLGFTPLWDAWFREWVVAAPSHSFVSLLSLGNHLLCSLGLTCSPSLVGCRRGSPPTPQCSNPGFTAGST